MKSIVISLEMATDRRKHIEQQFSQKNVAYEFFNALTPDVAVPLAEKMQLNIQEEFLTKGEVACMMSHISVWQKMVDENIPHLAVFEDDVYLGENADQYLNDDRWILSEWDIIKTEAFAEKVFLDSKEIVVGQRKIQRLIGKNLGTAGYILSLQGAKSYLAYVKRIQLTPLDQVMFNHYIEENGSAVYQMNPALCIQEMLLYPEKKQASLSSDLIKERKARMRKYKKKGWAKIQLEIARIAKQVKYALVGKAVSFK